MSNIEINTTKLAEITEMEKNLDILGNALDQIDPAKHVEAMMLILVEKGHIAFEAGNESTADALWEAADQLRTLAA